MGEVLLNEENNNTINKNYLPYYDIYNILENININISNEKIEVVYNSDGRNKILGFCEFKIRGENAILESFYTSNIKGYRKEELDKTQNLRINDLDILDYKVKNIGTEMFRNLLILLINKGVKFIYLTYNKESNSLEFYKKMQEKFPKYIFGVNEVVFGGLKIYLTQH